MRIKKTAAEIKQAKLIKEWKNTRAGYKATKRKSNSKKYKKAKVYEVPEICMEHYRQYLKARDVDNL